jgi:hypothetical protein
MKKPTLKQHIYFLPTRKANAEKIKELFFFQRTLNRNQLKFLLPLL